MFKERYQKYNSEIKPSEQLIRQTIQNVKKEKANFATYNMRKKVLRPVLIGGCLLLGTTFALPVLAETMKNIYELMYLVPEEIAEPFTPVEISTVSNDIKMEVVAIDMYNRTAKIYITLEDLVGGRFDDSIQLGSYHIDGIGTAICGSEFYAYEEELNKATFMLTIEDATSTDILETINQEIQFTLHDISLADIDLQGNDFQIPIALESAIAPSLGTQDIYYNGGSGNIEEYLGPTLELVGTSEDGTQIMKTLPIQGLIPNITPIPTGIRGVSITAVTYEDNLLSVQYGINMKKDSAGSSGNIYLRNIHDDTQAKEYEIRDSDILCLYSFGGVEDADAYRHLLDEYTYYKQYIFEVSEDEISDYELYGYGSSFRVDEECIIGDWQIDFLLESVLA